MQLGSTAIGVKTPEGVVLVVEKRVTSPLLVSGHPSAWFVGCSPLSWSCNKLFLLQEPSSIQKIAEIDQHIGVAMSGLTADAKTLIDRARVETQVAQNCVAVSYIETLVLNKIQSNRLESRSLSDMSHGFDLRLQQHRFSYDEPMPVESCTQALCDVALSFGEDDEQEGSMVSSIC